MGIIGSLVDCPGKRKRKRYGKLVVACIRAGQLNICHRNRIAGRIDICIIKLSGYNNLHIIGADCCFTNGEYCRRTSVINLFINGNSELVMIPVYESFCAIIQHVRCNIRIGFPYCQFIAVLLFASQGNPGCCHFLVGSGIFIRKVEFCGAGVNGDVVSLDNASGDLNTASACSAAVIFSAFCRNIGRKNTFIDCKVCRSLSLVIRGRALGDCLNSVFSGKFRDVGCISPVPCAFFLKVIHVIGVIAGNILCRRCRRRISIGEIRHGNGNRSILTVTDLIGKPCIQDKIFGAAADCIRIYPLSRDRIRVPSDKLTVRVIRRKFHQQIAVTLPGRYSGCCRIVAFHCFPAEVKSDFYGSGYADIDCGRSARKVVFILFVTEYIGISRLNLNSSGKPCAVYILFISWKQHFHFSRISGNHAVFYGKQCFIRRLLLGLSDGSGKGSCFRHFPIIYFGRGYSTNHIISAVCTGERHFLIDHNRNVFSRINGFKMAVYFKFYILTVYK